MDELEKEETFEDCIRQLRRAYDSNPYEVLEETKKAVKRVKKLEDVELGEDGKDLDINKSDVITICILIICIVIFGFFNMSSVPLYLFGLIFFLAGHFVGLREKYFGIIFLFSHSVTGMCIMEGALIGEIITGPVFTDSTLPVYMYFGLIVAILAIATIITIIFNVSEKFREKEHIAVLPMSFYFVGFLLSAVFPYVIDSLSTMQI